MSLKKQAEHGNNNDESHRPGLKPTAESSCYGADRMDLNILLCIRRRPGLLMLWLRHDWNVNDERRHRRDCEEG